MKARSMALVILIMLVTNILLPTINMAHGTITKLDGGFEDDGGGVVYMDSNASSSGIRIDKLSSDHVDANIGDIVFLTADFTNTGKTTFDLTFVEFYANDKKINQHDGAPLGPGASGEIEVPWIPDAAGTFTLKAIAYGYAWWGWWIFTLLVVKAKTGMVEDSQITIHPLGGSFSVHGIAILMVELPYIVFISTLAMAIAITVRPVKLRKGKVMNNDTTSSKSPTLFPKSLNGKL